MKNKTILLLSFIGFLTSVMITGPVQAAEILTEDDIIKKVVVKEQFIKMADNFIVMFDSSTSMDEPVRSGATELQYDVAKKILGEGNKRLPDLGFNGGLYLFTPFKEVYPMGMYDKTKFAQALTTLPAQAKGPTLLKEGLQRIEKILPRLVGRTVVFVFTDGTYNMSPAPEPWELTHRMARRHNVCFIIISDAKGRTPTSAVNRMANANACSRVIEFDTFIQNPEFITGALYVVKATENIQTITDTRIVGLRADNILFDLDQYTILPDFKDEADELGRFLKNNPGAYVLLEGYTCNIGSDEYNLGLSKRRSNSVAAHLMNNFGITRDRIVINYYGKENPVASNETEAGRAQNRRVEVAVGGL
jgi:OOP family OmpA-OmpF porin